MLYKAIFVSLAVATILTGYLLTRSNFSRDRQGLLEFTNLPDQYCPQSAAVVATDLNVKNPKILLDSKVLIDGCRFIFLNKLTTAQSLPRLVFVKLPGALAFRIEIDSLAGRYQFAPSLGDANSDNIIDATDELQVTNALASVDPAQLLANDLDHDGKISVIDLSLTRINRRTGVSRPDGKSWSHL